MSIDNQEITINLDAKRLVAITLLAVISIYTIYSYSIALFAFINVDANPPFIRVTSHNTYDTSNVQTDSFARGTTARVKASVEKASDYFTVAPAYTSFTESTTSKISVIVYYEDGGVINILKIQSKSVTLQPGVPYNIQLDFTIPSNAVTGTHYYAKIFVWDEYLPSGDNIRDLTYPVATSKMFSAT